MANNRMFLVNKRTGTRICLAKYYPSTGWFTYDSVAEKMHKGFHEADFGHFTEEDIKAKAAQPGFGPPYSDADPLMTGNEWALEYEHDS